MHRAGVMVTLVAILAGGCFNPDYTGGAFTCKQGRCPEGHVCVNEVCRPEGYKVEDLGLDLGADAGADTGTPDTGTPDGPQPDTGTPDGPQPDGPQPDTGTPDGPQPDGPQPDQGAPDLKPLPDQGPTCPTGQVPANSSVLDVEVSGDGKLFAASGTSGQVEVWETASKTLKHTFKQHTVQVYDFAFSATSPAKIASGDNGGTVYYWDALAGTIHNTIPTGSAIRAVALNKAGDRLATGHINGDLKLWDLTTSKLLKTYNHHGADIVFGLAFSPDGKQLASAGGKKVAILTLGSGGVAAPPAFTQTATKVVFRPDGKQVAATVGKLVALIDPVTTGVTYVIGQKSDITEVSYSHDSALLASGGVDMVIKLFSGTTFLKDLTGHTGTISGLAFSPAQKLLVSGGADKTVRLWCP